ncbi:MAG: hypothetical protein IH934_05345 [Nanoarchaeota archaeon]|nr:hypothetical protein [Nanoarchaeota archaeon]
MRNILLNTIFMIFLLITLVLFTLYNMIDTPETKENIGGFNEITGAMKTYEISHHIGKFYQPTKKYTKRYDEKLFEYLEHIQEQRDKTFMRGKVFLREK